MGSASSDSGRMQRRDSSNRSLSSRRPRLLRASATEPSITTSNASPNALSTQPGRRATELLTRMAFVSGSPPDSMLRSASILSTRSSMFDNVDRQGELSSSPVSQADSFEDRDPHPYSGRYFSFPSFDLYEASQEDEEKQSEIKSP
ncbi:uncharacterized protein THITE_2107426 [Thermothielavioides terrestris NRRL 8126]|uniref:Uncharacterized protein n=1 Tax=Thermothielavioides terrestris (strain ATCC 38088 / NRRL 8126) TaxID=578455 RepID=G2QTU5_THETT|nr:uncharacterized protein THITE_2107426 [Thermothielavioides terrestris NRRL 8126]AEO62805.1 hypothetical protein THITE_2107426 [Thermothielavioides terrestris NRRL 8126]